MKKTTFLKTLLMAVGLCMGGNAWGADVYTIIYGTPTYAGDGITVNGVTPQTDFTSDDGSTASDVTSSDANGSNCTNAMPIGGSVLYSNSTFTHNFTTAPTKGIVHFEANYTTTTNGQETWQILDSNGVEIFGTTDAGYSNGNDTKNWGFCNGVSLGTNWFRQARSAHNRVVLDINFTTRKVSYTVLVSSGNNSYSTLTGTYDLPAAVNDVKGLKANKQSYYSYMDNVSFYNVYDDAVTLYDYTVNYKLSEDVVKTVSASAAAGTVITAETALDGEGTYAGNHYLITAADAPTMTITSGTNVLDVPVRAPYTATVRLTKNINGASSYVDYPFTESDAKVCSYAVGWSMYEKDGDDYYGLTEETDYAAIGTFTNGQTINKTVNYTTAAPDIMSFKEIGGSSITSASYSGGSYSDTNEQLANVTVDAGVYDVIFNVVSKAGSGTNHRNEGVSVNDVNVANLEGNVNGIRTLRIIVENDNSLITAYGNGAGNHTDQLDYVIVRKIMDGTAVSGTITPCGWTTFASPYALNLSSMTASEGTVEAYYASNATGSTVTLTSTNSSAVAAGEGLMLKGTAGATITIPVVASGSAIAGNLLKGQTTEGTVEASNKGNNGKYHYVFGYTSSTDYGFYNLADDATVPAGKAYLETSSTLGARMALVFDDESTAISTVKETVSTDGGYYNLSGQRVAQPSKGLYIKNGKKVIMK